MRNNNLTHINRFINNNNTLYHNNTNTNIYTAKHLNKTTSHNPIDPPPVNSVR